MPPPATPQIESPVEAGGHFSKISGNISARQDKTCVLNMEGLVRYEKQSRIMERRMKISGKSTFVITR